MEDTLLRSLYVDGNSTLCRPCGRNSFRGWSFPDNSQQSFLRGTNVSDRVTQGPGMVQGDNPLFITSFIQTQI